MYIIYYDIYSLQLLQITPLIVDFTSVRYRSIDKKKSTHTHTKIKIIDRRDDKNK